MDGKDILWRLDLLVTGSALCLLIEKRFNQFEEEEDDQDDDDDEQREDDPTEARFTEDKDQRLPHHNTPPEAEVLPFALVVDKQQENGVDKEATEEGQGAEDTSAIE
ncbi:hypothetical protein RvY_12226 [Ramazzottius varieornatus]|uniref:Uncharacterized protein n=1 Tax=Ramazzottius varieornatus TaxID=947166 RepID=A0A1D1VIV4_RAMVA|nr:hypothetical protein RvY_12226 [Ramazzottius varieornatus]